MNSIQTTINELADETPIVKNLSVADGQRPLSISQPIDIGAEKLLRDFKNAWLTYPPLEVEYLMQTLNEHSNNCLEIRSDDVGVSTIVRKSVAAARCLSLPVPII